VKDEIKLKTEFERLKNSNNVVDISDGDEEAQRL
jgi:hypothetical protein